MQAAKRKYGEADGRQISKRGDSVAAAIFMTTGFGAILF